MPTFSLRELLGALAADLVRGEAYAAQATVEFLRAVGFEGSQRAGDWGPIRFIRFSYSTLGMDGNPVTRRIRVPLLSLVPVPLQHINQAEYEFFLRVSEVRPMNEQHTPTSDQKMEVRGEVAPYVADQPGKADVPRIRVRLAVKQSDLPAGLSSSLRRIEETSGEDI